MMFYRFGWQLEQRWFHGFTLRFVVEILSTGIWTLADFRECFSLLC